MKIKLINPNYKKLLIKPKKKEIDINKNLKRWNYQKTKPIIPNHLVYNY